ncbi:hypothetical protein COV24_01255 [candidate division WWE3 bacterium CG10_big_fil_rev_8_21_14_0_10_32_10]|uniref:Peptidase S11 D-alanyl-D-alanine carboxypeptidase A N-terminal domain-containing protein n=1 Tax=candidate division WWE3 bacterium CG10_big_fil_rev_8_21_14_0_10_32_10 TaxID=1975090 RepID=A0A2H0RBC2_UNCKA|nr:MAG: hypothetical protein COV24_01255 [candidate division WWE3 bacterium CG10_big_fil_rev_8_21_14_0_10_32_10]
MSKKKSTANFFSVYRKYYLLILGILLISLSSFLNYKFSESKVVKDLKKTIVYEPLESVLGDSDENGDKKAEKIEELPVQNGFSAKSYILYDVNSSQIVGGKDVDVLLPNASTTKLMSAYLVIKKYPLDSILTVPAECVGVEGNNVGFVAGEKFYVEDLLYGMLLRSASDATCVFSANYSKGTPGFVDEMNKEAKNLRLENTHYTNPIGLDDVNHYSSSRDLLKMTLELRKIEKLKIVMGSRDFTLKEISFGKRYYVSNTNELLFTLPGTVGYKTGFTSNAGECLVFGYNNFGTELIIVIMGSTDRFSDAKQLLRLYEQKAHPDAGIVESTTSVKPGN